MPTYSYRCKKCNKTVDVIRTMNEFDIPPSTDEFPIEETCDHAETERVLLSAPKKAYGDGWGSDRKGNYGRGW